MLGEVMMSRTPASNQVQSSESLLRNDLEDFSRDLLGLHARFQSMFPVLSNSRDSTATATTAPATTITQSQNPIPGHLRDRATGGLIAILPSSALTPSQSTAELNLTPCLERRIRHEIENKMKEELTELKGWVNAQDKEVFDSVGVNLDALRSQDLRLLEAHKKQVEKELNKMREENLKRQQADEKIREELWGLIRKMQAEIVELKKGKVRESVGGTELQKETQTKLQDFAAFEGELMSRHIRGPISGAQNEQSYTSSALVPFSPPAEKDTTALNTTRISQSGTPASGVGRLDLTTRPANRGNQSVTSVSGTNRESNDASSGAPVPPFNSHPRNDRNGLSLLSDPLPRVLDELPALRGSDEDDEDDAPITRRAHFGKESCTASDRRLGRLPQGTAPTNSSRSRSPRPSLHANFRVRDSGSESIPKSGDSRPTLRRSNSSSSDESIPNDNEHNLSSQSIPSRFQPSRRTKSANELIDKHLSFIPNGWRTILANTAKQLSSEDWDRSDARVLKKLEEHCPSFKGLEEILPNVKMAVPALRDLVRDLKKYC